MPRPVYVVALLYSAAMMAPKADTCPAETHVIELAELRQIVFEMQRRAKSRREGRTHCEQFEE